ncbi:hypothetical protein F4777DRAFT_79422 [Nemania sp. FL0916]|nr:hypothetical protein F4777DRAFT_79422 [Nemania sp. FL0916]
MAGKKQSSTSAKPGPGPGSSSAKGATKRIQQQQKETLRKYDLAADEEGAGGEELRHRQQTLLNIFSSAFRDVLGAEDFSARLQDLKTALFNRDFAAAFAREDALDVYAARWSPTRALCYGRVLRGLGTHLRGLVEEDASSSVRNGDGGDDDAACDEKDGDDAEDVAADRESKDSGALPKDQAEQEAIGSKTTPCLKVLAIGGGAAELVAFADYISSLDTTTTRCEITLVDIGPWAGVVQKLQTALTSPPVLSRYASAAVAAASKALVARDRLVSRFVQGDILALGRDELERLVGERGGNKGGGIREEGEGEKKRGSKPILITLLFTLNELYTAGGIKRTTAFLRLLSTIAVPGTLLLVVDSPGSYSEAAVGKDAKRYPMQWLLDHTLVPPPSPKKPGTKTAAEVRSVEDEAAPNAEANGVRWEKIESHDSVWFRVAEGLSYPIALENMRYQVHLYRAARSE